MKSSVIKLIRGTSIHSLFLTRESTVMNYTIQHIYINTVIDLVTKRENNEKIKVFSSKGKLPIRHPGSLRITVFAQYLIGKLVDHRIQKRAVDIPVSVKIFSPDGLEFTARHVTLKDLNRFRDARGVTQGTWRYAAHGDSGPIVLEDGESIIEASSRRGYIQIAIDETLPSQSAGPLVDDNITSVGTKVYSFDLYRVGQFEAKVGTGSFFSTWNGMLRLKDPSGAVVASSTNSSLKFLVTLRTLDQSRDAAGKIRKWSLEIETTRPGWGTVIRATVKTTVKIPVAVIQDRINDLIGAEGKKISIYGENKDGHALGRFKVNDPYTAETIDMHNLLDKVIEKVEQDPGVDASPFKENVVYNFVNEPESIGHGLSVDISSFKVDALKITLGASQHITPVVPAVTVTLDVQGAIDINLGGVNLATISLNNNSISLEAGAKLNDSGDVETVSWMNDDPIDIDISTIAWATVGALTGFQGLAALKEFLQHTINDIIIETFRSIVEDAIFRFTHIMVVLLGGNFTLTSLRMDGDAIIIEYVSPAEPDPKPNESYNPIIGRSVIFTFDGLRVWPRTLGDTWAADNLRQKIDHIVVVMMENRSFDHVLGYRAVLRDAQNEEGLSDELTDFLKTQGFEIGLLRRCERITKNPAGLRTRFPAHVGHSLAAVAKQLSQRLQTSSGLIINSPQGFVEDFEQGMGGSGLERDDVLGYYTGRDLTFYEFLADNYAYCQRYFSSHPGPTLPNRMYWLTGDVQYDRTGEPILDNNNSDNLQFSRALNIFDVLERKNISWRVYESFPSVAMLRMFARYAADNKNIVDIKDLEADIAAGNLPSVTFIEPRMHSAPPNDDHPVADMLEGQHFIKRVYDALHLNGAIWKKTLLIITYDEHGGFYDHVIPPIADALSPPLEHAPPFVHSTRGAPGSNALFKKNMTIPYGVRVPTFVISPCVPPGKGPDIVLDHCSIIKTILARFCGSDRPFLSDRVHWSHTFESFLTEPAPRVEVLSSPDPAPLHIPTRRSRETRAIVTKPVTRKAMDEGSADFHDITGMLARMLGRR